MAWKIELTKDAESFLDKLYKSNRKTLTLILKKLQIFSESPRQFGKPLKGNKEGIWRYRVGDYRILCSLNDNKMLVLVLTIGHRKDVYE